MFFGIMVSLMRGRTANTGEKIIIKADEKNYFDSMEL